jgi:hypothetical protein
LSKGNNRDAAGGFGRAGERGSKTWSIKDKSNGGHRNGGAEQNLGRDNTGEGGDNSELWDTVHDQISRDGGVKSLKTTLSINADRTKSSD